MCTAPPLGTREAQRTGTAAVQYTYEATLTQIAKTLTAQPTRTPAPTSTPREEPPYPGPGDELVVVRETWVIWLPLVGR